MKKGTIRFFRNTAVRRFGHQRMADQSNVLHLFWIGPLFILWKTKGVSHRDDRQYEQYLASFPMNDPRD